MNFSIDVPTIGIQEALAGDFVFVDVRTPAEYEEFRIPGSLNIPIFSNEERVEVGTTYKQVGQEEAKDIGIGILSAKLPEFYQRMKEIYGEQGKPMVVYCWRGGMRSRSIVVTMGTLGIPVVQLTGGIRSYRELVTEGLEEAAANPKPYLVLEGNTGTGKTEILQRLQQEGYPVMDLEGLASHRGSIFGQIGLEVRSQKMFESLLYWRLQELKDAPYYIIEAESKRIGRITLPPFLLAGKEGGTRIRLHLPMSERADIICEIYRFDLYKDKFYAAFQGISRHLPDGVRMEAEEAFHTENVHRIVEILFEYYYDPRYEHAANQYDTPVHPVFAETREDAYQQVKEQIDALAKQTQLSHS
ncbi:tRNA 2-selenouridine(34) synthase MnmH [Ectobacillus ponti]|uniref:tRNA 2-selenouridine(34) synthase MnmH n=1 Tax=Ectobacillus ponti TaxID=2961894 RepID=A0AA42BT47_9BACI|nr:tRNA 2-selenouridine(34) synthase MnmH [Ectobacillus ponti]MCP8969103.1 tRNA 2-selenouridine(34) synthase MnmH [Ectobacillus ponti]